MNHGRSVIARPAMVAGSIGLGLLLSACGGPAPSPPGAAPDPAVAQTRTGIDWKKQSTAAWTAPAGTELVGVTDDRVVLYDYVKGLTGLDLTTGQVAWEAEEPDQCAMSASTLFCYDMTSGDGNYRDPKTGAEGNAVALGADVAFVEAGPRGVYSVHSALDGGIETPAVNAWDLDGKAAWTVNGPEAGYYWDPLSPISVRGEFVQVVLYRDPASGSDAWHVLLNPADGSVVAEDATVTKRGELVRIGETSTELLDDKGDVVRTVKGRVGIEGEEPIDPAGDVLTVDDFQLQPVAPDGSSRWTAPADPYGSVRTCGDRATVSEQHSLTLIDTTSGETLWQIPAPVPFPVVQCAGDVLLNTKEQVEGNEDGPPTMVAVDAATGDELWFIPAAGTGTWTAAGLLVHDVGEQAVRLYR